MFCEILTTRHTISNVEDNGSGLIRITTSGAHGLSNGDKIIIDAVTGTTEANGYWAVTVVNTTQFTLDSSAFVTTWAGGGNVCDGQSYSVVMGSNGSNGILVSADIKNVNSSGVVATVSKSVKKITGTTETEIFRGDPSVFKAIACMSLTNNSGSSRAGSIKVRTTKRDSSVAEIFCPFTLPDAHTLVIGGDGVRSMYQASGIPYV